MIGTDSHQDECVEDDGRGTIDDQPTRAVFNWTNYSRFRHSFLPLLTTAIPIDQVREAPHISKANRIPDAGESEFKLTAPIAPLWFCLCRRRRPSRAAAVHRGRWLIDDIGCAAAPTGQVRFTWANRGRLVKGEGERYQEIGRSAGNKIIIYLRVGGRDGQTDSSRRSGTRLNKLTDRLDTMVFLWTRIAMREYKCQVVLVGWRRWMAFRFAGGWLDFGHGWLNVSDCSLVLA